jgi:integrase
MTPLHRAIVDYLALRRQLGVTLPEAGRVLTAFATFAEQEGVACVTTALVLRWASQLTHVSPATINGRLQMIRRFAQWRQLTDARTEVPAVDLLPGRYRRRPPRLYREDDIPRLLQAARQLPSAKGLRGRTYERLFGLLTVTGLRSSEVVALNDGDLDHRQTTLLVRRTKFGKSRLVPVHASTMEALATYQAIRNRVIRQRLDDALFVSERGVRITQGAAEYTFARVSADIGVRPPFRAHRLGRGSPRLHDLRHRFAIRTLVDGYRGGGAVDPLLPVLATYLGHVHVHDTYWYLEAVPELLQRDGATDRRRKGGSMTASASLASLLQRFFTERLVRPTCSPTPRAARPGRRCRTSRTPFIRPSRSLKSKTSRGTTCGIMPTAGLCRLLSARSGIAVEIAQFQRPRSA